MDKLCIVDNRYFDLLCDAFSFLCPFFPAPSLPDLSEPVASHADMGLFVVDKTALCAPSVYPVYRDMLTPYGITVMPGKKEPGKTYPQDIAYNILHGKNCAFGLFTMADLLALDLLEKKGVPLFPVKQGYSRCSSLLVGDGLISADPSMLAAGKKAGLKTLTLTPGHIKLPGYDCGFIGGSAGVVGKTVVFCGDVSFHPQGEEIVAFIDALGFSVAQIPGMPLLDVGSIFCIDL